jgi:hypothetical protein
MGSRRRVNSDVMRFLMSIFLLAIFGTVAQAQTIPLPVPTPIVDPFDHYGNVSWENEMARLDNYAIAIENDPRMVAEIAVFGDKNGCSLNAQRRALRAKNYLVQRRGIDPNRIIWRDLGYLDEQEVWLEGQVRGAEPYPWWHPQPLPRSQVKRKNCRTGSKHRTGGKHAKRA